MRHQLAVVGVIAGMAFMLSGCVPALIVGGVYHSSKTKGQRQEFQAAFQEQNLSREKAGLPLLDWCSEAYHFDKKYAMTDANCKARVKAYEKGDQTALSGSVLKMDTTPTTTPQTAEPTPAPEPQKQHKGKR